MRLEYLEYLVDFAETGSIAKTAARFVMSYQGMSRALYELEKEAGEKLFDRKGRSVSLSKEGRAYLEYIKPVVESYDKAQKRMQRLKERRDETGHDLLHLRATPMAGRGVLPLLIENIPFRSYVRLGEIDLFESLTSLSSGPFEKAIGIVTIPAVGVMREEFLSRLNEQAGGAGLYELIPLAKTSNVLLVSETSPYAQDDAFQYDNLANCKVGALNDLAMLDVLDANVAVENVHITSSWHVLLKMTEMDRIVVPVPAIILAHMRIPPSIKQLPIMKGDRELDGPTYALLVPASATDDEDVKSYIDEITSFFHSEKEQSRYKGYWIAATDL